VSLGSATDVAARSRAAITPRHYSLALDPRLSERRFSGEISIVVLVHEEVTQVVLDAEGLEVSYAEIDGVSAIVQQLPDQIRLLSKVPLEVGQATIRITFSGLLGTAQRGLYLVDDCSFTQLQPSYARRLFPCFDTPHLKATFDIAVTAAKDHSVLSNTAPIREESLGERHRVTFATSAPLPPYLVGIAIGAFDSVSGGGDPTCIRFHAPERVLHGEFALEAAQGFLRFYNGWFSIPYGLDKLDLVSVPAFEVQGMENSGAIFFNETAVSIDPARVSAAKKKHTANLIAHELAHHWFGSLITPASWADLWLSEGFATWIAPRAVAAWDPTLALDIEELCAVRSAMAADSLASSRAMGTDATTPAAIKELFDPIAYRKGAAILKMLESWLGEEAFRRGVNLYLERHAHGTATATDLWKALTEVSGLDVAEVAMPFQSTPGVPQIEVEWNGDVVRLTQAASSFTNIPLSLKVGFADGRVEVHRTSLRFPGAELRMPGTVQWVFGNAGATGYYRCLHANVHAIPLPQLSALEQTALLADTWDAVWSGSCDTLEYLRLARDLLEVGATSHELLSHIGQLRELLATGARRLQLDAWLVNHAQKEADNEVALALLGAAGDANAIARSRELTSAWLEGASVDAERLDAATIIAAQHGDEKLFDRLLAALTSGERDVSRLLRMIAAFESPACMEKQLALVDHPRLSSSNLLSYFENLLSNAATRAKAWSFLKTDWETSGSRLVSFGGRGAILSLGAFSESGARADIASFFARREIAGAERALAQTLERIDARIRFREREQRRFDAWLVRQSAPGLEVSEPLRLAHELINLLSAGFHGALYNRVLFDRMGLNPPAWMHPADDLRSAVAGLEKLFLYLFRGFVRIDASVVQLATRLNEDLMASSELAASAIERLRSSADPSSAPIVSVLFAREVASREHALDGSIAFAALFGMEQEANSWRRELRSSAADADRAQRWLRRVAQSGLGRALRLELATDAQRLTSTFREESLALATVLQQVR